MSGAKDDVDGESEEHIANAYGRSNKEEWVEQYIWMIIGNWLMFQIALQFLWYLGFVIVCVCANTMSFFRPCGANFQLFLLITRQRCAFP